jgi:hypothetical protein
MPAVSPHPFQARTHVCIEPREAGIVVGTEPLGDAEIKNCYLRNVVREA